MTDPRPLKLANEEDASVFTPPERSETCVCCSAKLRVPKSSHPWFQSEKCPSCGRNPQWYRHTENIERREVHTCRRCKEPFVTRVRYTVSWHYHAGMPDGALSSERRRGKTSASASTRCRACDSIVSAESHEASARSRREEAARFRESTRRNVIAFLAAQKKKEENA